MLVLDTDHLTEIERGSAIGAALAQRLERSGDDVATTIISVEEQLRGWLAEIGRRRNPHSQIDVYAKMHRRIEFFAEWQVLPWSELAADRFRDCRRTRLRVGSMDLKIACIAMGNNAKLLSRNLVDFRKIAGLDVENWL